MNPGLGHIAVQKRQPVPRGIARSGPPILSYGFRPFFLAAGAFAVVAMVAWLGALTLGWEVGGDYGALNWHAHEMLFGYASAALAGYMLTAIPNWTGRLPVSGMPLLALLTVWLLGRIGMAFPGVFSPPLWMFIDACFLPLMAIVAGIEIVAGRNWKNLKILSALSALALANIAFHVSIALTGSAAEAGRLGAGIYVMLIGIVGGRIVPSFTRNWLVKAGARQLPAPFNRLDIAALCALLPALLLWVAFPVSQLTAAFALLAAAVNVVRLARWRGWSTTEEPLLLILHVGYAFVPLGLVAVALSAMGWIAMASALHVLTVGAIGVMTLAVMTRASLGHTGRPLTASTSTGIAYLALVLAAVLRPFAELIPAQYHLLLSLGALGWLAAFGIFVAEYGPMLLSPRQAPQKAGT